MRIGLFGGTFNPIHKGHIRIAKFATTKFNLNKVFFIVANIPPHKSEENIVDSNHRFNMVKYAINNMKKFYISDFEILRKGISYSYYTIQYFIGKFPNANLFYIIGEDELKILPQWYRINEIMRLIDFIVISRSDTTVWKEGLGYNSQNSPKIHRVKIKLINISSTYIRRFIWRKKRIWKMLPKAVVVYIKNHLLYL